MTARVGRNDPCPCGSGKKYKQCCLSKQQEQKGPSLGQRKFTAKVISAGGMPKQETQPSEQAQMNQAAIDYNLLMERSFGSAIHSTDEKPPMPENPADYLPKKPESNEHV